MGKRDERMMSMDEAVTHIMRTTGKTRRQAKYALIEALRSGKLPAYATHNETGETVQVPANAWPEIN